MTEYELWTHPAAYSRAIDSVSVRLQRPAGDRLLLAYRVAGRIDDIVIASPSQALRRDRLWESTCFELFLQPAETSAYLEFNFSPSGEWAAYQLDNYRSGMAQAAIPAAPQVAVTRDAGGMLVEVDLSLWPFREPCRVGIGVIIEEKTGPKSYWAITHNGREPDFHRADCFVGELPPPESA